MTLRIHLHILATSLFILAPGAGPFKAAAIRFGPPINPSSYGGGRRTRRRLITEDVMTAIQSLSGQQRRSD